MLRRILYLRIQWPLTERISIVKLYAPLQTFSSYFVYFCLVLELCNKHRSFTDIRELKQRRQPEVSLSPFLNALTLTTLYCYGFIRQFQTNHCPMMEKVHFRLTSVAQQRCCLSFLLTFINQVCSTDENFLINY